jgi:LmbE family N-acetylglucosaminyl deacetylase
MKRSEMAALRQDEQRAAAAVVGVSDVRFLGHPDGCVQATLDLRRDISRVIRQVQPERVITQSPERNWDFIYASHPDHMALGEAAVDAVYPDARNPFAHPELLEEGLEPWSVPELWIMGPGPGSAAPGSRIAVETTATVDRKVSALMCHKSQLPDPEATAARVRAGALAVGATAGLPEGHSAEVFRVTRIP